LNKDVARIFFFEYCIHWHITVKRYIYIFKKEIFNSNNML